MARVDLHNHLGRNGRNPGFDETINLVHARLGNRGVFGICNNGPDDRRYEEFVQQRGNYDRVPLSDDKRGFWVPQKNIYVVGVEEAEPKEGSFIAIGMPMNKKICSAQLTDALKAAEDLMTTQIIVHPFFRDAMGPYILKNPDMLNHFHGWEIYNASVQLGQLLLPNYCCSPRDANQKAARFYPLAESYGLGAVAFTDGHSCSIIGRTWTEMDLSADKNIFFDELRQGIVCSRVDKRLHKKPAKWDAFKHAIHMAGLMIRK